MSFIYPLGLIGLIGVPILIIIYIIKNKYTEQIVTSTYLWTLSEKFLKKKKQINLLSGIISLILQLLAVILISLALANPVFKIPNAAKEYCFILDASGSMNMEINNQTKFEAGIEEIEKIINDSKNGSKYTLVYAGATTRVIYEKLEDKDKAVELLSKLEPSGIAVSYNATLKYVQEYFNNNSSLVSYLITDRDYNSENVNIINVSNDDENYAVLNTNYLVEGMTLTITGDVVSYSKDTIINLDIIVDDNLETTLEIDCKKGVETSFSYKTSKIDFNKINLNVKNIDKLMIDNEKIIYNAEKEHDYNTLIVSDRPFYIEAAIKTLGNTSINVISRDSYDDSYRGYNLYVFDSFAPYYLPSDGTVWLFGVSTSIEGAGFSVQDVVKVEGYDDENAAITSEGMLLTYPNNSSSEFRKITEGINNDKIYLSKYAKYGLYRNFNTILNHEGNPLVFTGTTDQGNIEVVFAFDLHDSNLPLLIDYLVLTKNLLSYSFPNIIEESNYICGDEATINVLGNFDSIRVESPNGNISYLSTNSQKATLKLNEVGTYKIIIMSENETKIFNLYSSLPKEESTTVYEVVDFGLTGKLHNEYSDGKYEELIIFFIILSVIFMADWVVYCYEQYQLR